MKNKTKIEGQQKSIDLYVVFAFEYFRFLYPAKWPNFQSHTNRERTNFYTF